MALPSMLCDGDDKKLLSRVSFSTMLGWVLNVLLTDENESGRVNEEDEEEDDLVVDSGVIIIRLTNAFVAGVAVADIVMVLLGR